MASSESSLLVLEDVVVSLESSLWDSSPKELIDSMNLPISSISTSRDVSSIQPKTRRLDEAYHRLQLLHLSQNLEDKRLLQKKTQKMREKTRKVCRINKNWPFDVVLISFFCALMQNAELQQNSKTWKLGGFSVQATESLRLGGAATHASVIRSLGLDVSSLPMDSMDSLADGAASSASKPCLSYQLYLKWPITWPILWLLYGLPSHFVSCHGLPVLASVNSNLAKRFPLRRWRNLFPAFRTSFLTGKTGKGYIFKGPRHLESHTKSIQIPIMSNVCVCVCYRYSMCNQNYMHLSRPESAVDLHSFCHRPWTLYPVFATSLAVATSLTSNWFCRWIWWDMRSEEKWNEKKLLSKPKHLIRLAGLVSWSQNQLLYQTRMSNLGSEARVRLNRS